MEKNFHLVEQRLENIKTIKPLLMSLRTISLSSWKLSLNRLSYLEKFTQDLEASLGDIINVEDSAVEDLQNEMAMLIFGSSRGLCGSFNRDLFDHLKYYLSDHPHVKMKYIVVGEKIKKLFDKNQIEVHQFFNYPRASAINFRFADQISTQISGAVQLQPLLLLFNSYQGSSKYQPTIQRILAPLENKRLRKPKLDNTIIDGDFNDLARFRHKQDYLISIYKALLSSFAAEHSRRFQIMESSLSNTDKLIQELTISVQVERQKRVTSEMRELSVSAGLLNK